MGFVRHSIQTDPVSGFTYSIVLIEATWVFDSLPLSQALERRQYGELLAERWSHSEGDLGEFQVRDTVVREIDVDPDTVHLKYQGGSRDPLIEQIAWI